jgi:hypothetical protein
MSWIFISCVGNPAGYPVSDVTEYPVSGLTGYEIRSNHYLVHPWKKNPQTVSQF